MGALTEKRKMDQLGIYLQPTEIIDSDHPEIRALADKTVGDETDPINRAVRLGIWYDPYYPFFRAEHYRASNVLRAGRGFCIPKVSLLCALARASGIHARPGFATVRNHLATRQLLDFLGTDLFSFHGFAEFLLEGKWVKATPAFNKELCKRHGVAPLEFNGREDSIFQPYNSERRKFMEYVQFHGSFPDIPVSEILAAWEKTYGHERVAQWIEGFETCGDIRKGRFDTETIVGAAE
jgi:transglutaminase-like putative cysteine protease